MSGRYLCPTVLFANFFIFSMVAHAKEPVVSIQPCLQNCRKELDDCLEKSKSFVVEEQLKKQADVCEEKGETCGKECREAGNKALRAYRYCLERLALDDELENKALCKEKAKVSTEDSSIEIR